MDIATKNSWKTLDLPAQHLVSQLNKSLTNEEMQLASQGFIPESMDDKWFIYWDAENHYFYFHRSWTGACIYKLKVETKAEAYWLTEVCINRDSSQYTSTDEAGDLQTLSFLIDAFLLRK